MMSSVVRSVFNMTLYCQIDNILSIATEKILLKP
jgi:hypothetical protein